MRHQLPLLVLVLVLLALGFGVLGGAWAFPSADVPVRTVCSEVPSPSGGHVALLVQVSGGGAAGYVHEEVQLRRQGQPGCEVVATRLRGVQLQWEGAAELLVEHARGAPGRAEVDGVSVRYANPR